MTIVENDGVPTVSFDTLSSTTVGSTEEAVASQSIGVTLSAISASNVVVPYTIGVASTAVSGTDFTDVTSGSITITAGDTT